MKIFFFSCIICLFNISPVLSQSEFVDKPIDNFEVKIGVETFRIVPTVGIGRNFYVSKSVSLSPELLVLGAPILGGTFRLNIPIIGSFKLSPEAGFGFTPVGFPLSTVGILGINLSYELNGKFKLFVEPRIFYYGENIIAVGKGFFGIDNLNEHKPFVISFGIGF